MVAKVLSYNVSNVGNGTAESFAYFKLAWKMSVTTNQINIVWFAALIKITKTLRPFGQFFLTQIGGLFQKRFQSQKDTCNLAISLRTANSKFIFD